MAKKRQDNNDLNRSLAMSVALHVAVIILFILGSTMTVLKVSGGGGGAIDAVMLDPGTLTQTANQQTDKQKELEAQRKAEELKAKQEAEKKRLEEERVKKEVEQAKQEEEIRKAAAERKAAEAAEQARIKQEQDEKAKQQAEDAQKIAEAKKAEEARLAAEKVKAEEAKKVEEARKAEQAKKEEEIRKAAEVKKAAEAKKAAEQKAQQQANTNDVNSLLDDLVGSPPPSSQRGSGTSTGVGSGAREGQINEYVSQIKSAIERHLNDYHLYKGKTCDLKITLAKDGGRLINATIVKGDSALCQLALSAALEVNIPKPPSAAVYEAVKNAILVFEPK